MSIRRAAQDKGGEMKNSRNDLGPNGPNRTGPKGWEGVLEYIVRSEEYRAGI
jgi:hypothetical protein